MLPGRLIGGAAAVAALALLAGCSGGEGGAIEENVVRPGVTAIQEGAPAAACAIDVETLRLAIEVYETLNGEPPADESALLAERMIREESQVLDVADGQIVAVDPSCKTVVPAVTAPGGSAPLTAPATDLGGIVTGTEPLQTADEILAGMSAAGVASLGGEACARELAEIFAASERFVAERAENPTTLADLVDAGYLDEPVELWAVEADQLIPVTGSGCIPPG